MAPGLVGVLWGVSNSSETGGFGRGDVLAPLIAGIVLLTPFAAWASRRKARALVDLRLLKHWPLASSSLLLFLSGITLYGAMLLVPLYFQELRGTTVLEVGLLLIPQGLGTLASRSLAGRLADIMGARWLVLAGFLIVLVGTLPFGFADAHTSEWWLMAALFVRGIGLGVVTIPLMALGFRGLERSEVPDASIITRIASQVGGSFGAAVLVVILAAASARASSTASLSDAFQRSFLWAIGFAGVGVLVSLALPGRLPGTTGTSTQASVATHGPARSAAEPR